jgi:hemolysin D
LRQARLAEFASQRKDAEAEIARQGAALAVASEEVNRARQLRAVAAEREGAYRELAKTGMVSRQGYLPHWQDLVDAESTQRVRRQELRRASEEVPRARTRLETLVESRRARLLADISERTAEQAALEHDLVRLTQENDLQILRAPVSGTVQSILAVSPGSVVPAAQPIVSVVPDGAVLTVEAFIPPGDVGFLKPGQAVEVKVDAYPFERYGTLPGTLEWVSPDAEASDRDPINRQARVPAPNGVTGYRARIQLRRETLGTNSTQLAVRPGMTVRAEIQTDERRIVDYLLAPVLRRLDEGTKGS